MVNEIFEHTVTKRPEGRYRLCRVTMIFGYIIFALAYFLICYKSGFVPVFALCPFLLWILVFFTWRYVSIEYKYTVEAGILKLFVIYGGKSQKEKASLHIKEAAGFFPLSDVSALNKLSAAKKLSLLSSGRHSNDAYALLISKGGTSFAVFLEAPEAAKKAISYYLDDSVKHGKPDNSEAC